MIHLFVGLRPSALFGLLFLLTFWNIGVLHLLVRIQVYNTRQRLPPTHLGLPLFPTFRNTLHNLPTPPLDFAATSTQPHDPDNPSDSPNLTTDSLHTLLAHFSLPAPPLALLATPT